METATATATKKIKNISVTRIMIGLNELGNLPIGDFKINLGITRTITFLSPIEQAFQKSKKALMDKHISQDDKGNYRVDEGKLFIYKSVKDKEEYAKEVVKLDDAEHEVSFIIKATELQKISGLKASTMNKFHELIDDDIK